MAESNYSIMEMMICSAAATLKDGKTVAVGTGAPCAATMLAQKSHAPNLVIMFEAGGIAPVLAQMPISVGDSRTFYQADAATGMYEMMTTCSRGMVDYAFLGGAQIDQYGNLNSTVIGDFDHPKVRFPGSGGGNDFASLCRRTMVMTHHNKSRFVEKVSFLTSPGFLTGEGAREEAGLPDDTGPYKIITDLGVMGFDDKTKKMKVEALNPGVDLKKIQENTEFELMVSDQLENISAPTADLLNILRKEVDPHGYVIGRG